MGAGRLVWLAELRSAEFCRCLPCDHLLRVCVPLGSSVPGPLALELVQHPRTFTGDSRLSPFPSLCWPEWAPLHSLTGVSVHDTGADAATSARGLSREKKGKDKRELKSSTDFGRTHLFLPAFSLPHYFCSWQTQKHSV